MEIDATRVERMRGKWINDISAEDLNASNFEEYLRSRIESSKTKLGRKIKSSGLGRIFYGAEYDSHRERHCSALRLRGVDLDSFKKGTHLNCSMQTLTEVLKKVEETGGRGETEKPVLAENKKGLYGRIHNYLAEREGYHWQYGHPLRSSGWGFLGLFFRRGKDNNYVPSLR